MEYFLEIKFLLRGLITLKKRTETKTHCGKLKMEKRNPRHLDFDSGGDAFQIPGRCQKPCALAKSDCWNHLHVFLFQLFLLQLHHRYS